MFPRFQRLRDKINDDKWLQTAIAVITVFILAVLAGMIIFWFYSRKHTAINSIEEIRLPTNFRPEKYELGIKVYLPGYEATISRSDKFKFEGTQKNLKIYYVKVNSIEQEWHSDDFFEFLAVKLNEMLPLGNHTLEIEYQGNMGPYDEDSVGLYHFPNNAGGNDESPQAAVTQFSPFHARRMIPCFDEPEYKAKWIVTVEHPVGTIALSNGEQTTKTTHANWQRTSFATTPIMSSYLLSIFVGNYSNIEIKTTRGTTLRIYGPEIGKINRTAAETRSTELQNAKILLEHFEDLFQLPYSLSKLDMVYADLKYLGMENWGLTTINRAQRLGAEVWVHELAHNWFGNLVTPKWWNNVWLKEGFAQYYSILGMEKLFPGTLAADKLYFNTQEVALEFDNVDRPALTHNITYELYKQAIFFGSITYAKGPMFVAMIRNILGEEPFTQGIRNYLKKYAYNNTEPLNFFREINDAVPDGKMGPRGEKLNMAWFGFKWIEQPGYPVVSLVPINSTHANITQKVFMDPKSTLNYSNAKHSWDIPVWIQREDNTEFEFYWLPANIPKRRGELIIPYKADKRVVINPEGLAYFRTNYTRTAWLSILNELYGNKTAYTFRTRNRILSDARLFVLNNTNIGLTENLRKFIEDSGRQKY